MHRRELRHDRGAMSADLDGQCVHTMERTWVGNRAKGVSTAVVISDEALLDFVWSLPFDDCAMMRKMYPFAIDYNVHRRLLRFGRHVRIRHRNWMMHQTGTKCCFCFCVMAMPVGVGDGILETRCKTHQFLVSRLVWRIESVGTGRHSSTPS